MTAPPNHGPRGVRRMRVAICGGGVAAIEALLGLRALLGLAPHVELIAPNRRFVYEPLAVAEPFGRRLDGRCGRSSRDRLDGRVQGTPDRGILI
jgi:NADH dehydrogenase FAD-containing subunit